MAEENSQPRAQQTRPSAIVWCCLLPNLLVVILAGLVWSLAIFGDWQPAGLQLLTQAETLQRVQDVVGIGGVFLSAVLLPLILVPNMIITVLVSGRGFHSRKAAFFLGLLVCLLLPTITITMLSLIQSPPG